MIITIKGRVPSKKNNRKMFVVPMKKIVKKRIVVINRIIISPSTNYEKWHKDASKQLEGIPNIPPNTFLTYHFYAPDKRKGDLSNKIESINDLFVDCGIIDDDNWYILDDYRVKFMGVDKENPRCEIHFNID